MGRFLTYKDMASAKHEEEVMNSRINRGVVDTKNTTRTAHVVCGCGASGCIFISHWKNRAG